jgi:hypothetical protein
MENLDSIRRIKRNEFVLNALVTQLKTALGVLPFVGAGLSIPFGFKGWQEFLLTIESGIPRAEISRRIDTWQKKPSQGLTKLMACCLIPATRFITTGER